MSECEHVYTKCWGGYHCLLCMTYFFQMFRPEPKGIINWDQMA